MLFFMFSRIATFEVYYVKQQTTKEFMFQFYMTKTELT